MDGEHSKGYFVKAATRAIRIAVALYLITRILWSINMRRDNDQGHSWTGFILILALLGLLLVTAGCGHVSDNLEDGYQRGDIAGGIKQDRAWYCGEGLMGIRAVARYTIALTTSTALPDVCKAIDVIVESE